MRPRFPRGARLRCGFAAINDVGRFMRLRGAIKAALESVPVDHSSAYEALAAAYSRLREQVSELVGSGYPDFDDLFPDSVSTAGATGNISRDPMILFKQQEVASAARTLLGQLAGWMDGLIQEAQYSAQLQPRSGERRVGKGCVREGRSR